MRTMRLIDVDKVTDICDNSFWPETVKKRVAALPTIDAVPVVHGEWREVEVDKRIVYCCTVCHTVVHNMPNPATFMMFHYCPHCGAKMVDPYYGKKMGGGDDE